MTPQELFNRVTTHLLTQMTQSGDGSRCKYRDAYGRKCAVGCLIPDEAYDLALEGLSVETLRVSMAADLIDYGPGLIQLARRLQLVHDLSNPGDWKRHLLDAAKEFDLSSAVLDNFP